jgi:hypothetical protein
MSARAVEVLDREKQLLSEGIAVRFASNAADTQRELSRLVMELTRSGKTVYAYGATAKGATLLNTSGLSYKQIPYCADSTPIKQGRFIPKCGVEIASEEWVFQNPPDYFLLTAWNYRDELIAKVRAAGLTEARFIVPVPNVSVI